jgi:hypothetical protein
VIGVSRLDVEKEEKAVENFELSGLSTVRFAKWVGSKCEKIKWVRARITNLDRLHLMVLIPCILQVDRTCSNGTQTGCEND